MRTMALVNEGGAPVQFLQGSVCASSQLTSIECLLQVMPSSKVFAFHV